MDSWPARRASTSARCERPLAFLRSLHRSLFKGLLHSTTRLRPSASSAAVGRRIQNGMRSDLLILALRCSLRDREALDLKPEPALGFTPAANSVLLPKAEPRAVRKHFVVPPIRSREVARAQRSGVRYCEDALKPLDVGNSLLGVHSVLISNIGVAMVKPSGTRTFPQ